ncbi:MAG TPA: hypothetical protein VL593_12395 [Ramlibacter sp.]|nr:hypothetical protein [Ramlibacter sp.]
MHSKISNSRGFPSVSAAGYDPGEPMQVELGPPGEWFKWQATDRRRDAADIVSELGAFARAGHCSPRDLEDELVAAMHVVIEHDLPRAEFVDAVMRLWFDGHVTKEMVTNVLAGRWNDRTPMEHELSHHRGRPGVLFAAFMKHLPADDRGEHCLLPDEIVDACSVRATSQADPNHLIELFCSVGGAADLSLEARVRILGKIAQQAGKEPASAGAMMYGIVESTAQPHEARALLKMLPLTLKDIRRNVAADIWKVISVGMVNLAHAEALLAARAGKVGLSRCPTNIKASVRTAHLRPVRTSEPGQMVCSATHAIPTFVLLPASAARPADDPHLYYYEIPLANLEVSGLRGSRLKL